MTILTVPSAPVDDHDWSGCMKTLNGTMFNILAPRPEDVTIEEIAHTLAMQVRYNGHVPFHYSVAEHSCRVSERLRELGLSLGIQLEGLLHDAPECYIGDLIRPMKLVPELGEPFEAIEDPLCAVIFEAVGLGVTNYPMSGWVKDADKWVYEWEVENIRTGITKGMKWEMAEQYFLVKYENLKREILRAKQNGSF